MKTFSYRGTPNIWRRLVDDDHTKPPAHFHKCPECYDYASCSLPCTLEPDLELDDGTPVGGTTPCDHCMRTPKPHEHPCPKCVNDTLCYDPTCSLLTVADEMELARGKHQVCERCLRHEENPNQLRLFTV